MFEYLLFDLDGTLTDPKEGITKCVQYALDYYGIHVDDLDKLTNFIGPPMTTSFHDFYGFDEKKSEEATAKFRERYNVIGWKENRPLDGAAQMLEHLKTAGKKLAVATSKPEPTAVKVLDEFSLSQYFDTIAGSCFSGERNTKALVIEEALKRLGVSGEERRRAVMIGDRKHDIAGAKECGLASIGINVGYAEDGEFEKAGADYIFQTFEQLEEFLLGC